MKKTNVATVRYDSEQDEYFIEFGEDLMEDLGWKIGDTLEWEDLSNGSFSIKKVRTGEDKMSVTVQRIEYHQVHSYMTYVIDEQDIIEEFGSVDRFKDIGFSMDGDMYEPDEPIEADEYDKFYDFVANYDYDREDDWFTDRKGGYDVEYCFPKEDE